MATRRFGHVLLTFYLAACLSGALTGCKARDSAPVSLEIGYLFHSLITPWHDSYLKAFKEEAKRHPNLEIDWFDGNSAPQAIPVAIEKWIARKIDLIVSSSPDHMPLRMTYKKALDAGIPVILTGDTPDYRVYEYMTAFSGISGWDGSRMAAELLNQALGVQGRIAYITAPRGSASEQQSTEGFKAALLRLSSHMEIVATEDGRGDATFAYQKALDLLTRLPKIDAFYAADDTMGSAVIRALKEKGRTPGQVKVVAQGGSKGSITDLREGWYLGIVNQDPALCAQQDVWLMLSLLEEGRRLPLVAQVRQEMITPDNVNRFPGW